MPVAMRHRYVIAPSVAILVIVLVLLVLPEALGDWPYDPGPEKVLSHLGVRV
jgi:hypothetical protein